MISSLSSPPVPTEASHEPSPQSAAVRLAVGRTPTLRERWGLGRDAALLQLDVDHPSNGIEQLHAVVEEG